MDFYNALNTIICPHRPDYEKLLDDKITFNRMVLFNYSKFNLFVNLFYFKIGTIQDFKKLSE